MNKTSMRRLPAVILLFALASGCKQKAGSDTFTVSGKITGHKARMIYLEEIPVTMQRLIVDSAKLGSDGKFKLHTDAKEAMVYNLRLDQNAYPLASIINDAPELTVDVKMSKDNDQFAESYDVKGSPASTQMKDFMLSMNNDLQKIYAISTKADSMVANGAASDSIINAMMAERAGVAQHTKKVFQDAMALSKNPALSLFELSYYQTMSNNPSFKLESVNNEDVNKLIADLSVKFPDHHGLASVKGQLDAEKRKQSGWVGQQAPDFSLPDVNGNPVKLSSFRGKYVLVDFWASWCGPCRAENPNVVKAFNRFKDKNFTVLGVSLDKPDGKEAWQKAIMNDHLTWTHVSDLQFWNSSVVALYGFDGIPFNVLVDPTGKVIGQGLRGEDLENKLTEVLK